jgi:DnaJ-domain-containing protein 1
MSISSRLLRIAQRRVKEGLGLVQGAAFRDPAREELEDFLRSPGGTRSSNPRPEGSGGSYSRPAAAPRHPYEAEYRLLGAPIGSDLPTVQQCWRQRVRESHPDRFAGNPDEQRRATDRLRQINEAHERLRTHLR